MYQLKTDRAERRKLKIHNYNWKLQRSSLSNRKINQENFKYRNNLTITINHPALIEIYKIIHQTTTEHKFFSSAYVTF